MPVRVELITEFQQLQLATTVLHDRKSYRDAVREGRAVFELEQTGARKAAEEIWSMLAELAVEPSLEKTEVLHAVLS